MRSSRLNLFSIPTSTWLLAGILLVACVLRVWGVWFGLPHLFHNDEGFEVIRALQLGSGQFDFERVGKGGYFYLLFIEYGVLFVALFVLGVVKTANDFALYFVNDPSAFYLVGRTTTALIGALNVYLVYRLGRLAYSRTAGLIAAAFLAVNVLHSSLSHFVTVDVPMTCLATAALLFAVRLSNSGGARDYRLAAIFAALATATKMPAVLLVFPLFGAHWLVCRAEKKKPGQIMLDARLWQSIGIFVVLYVLLAPGIIINFRDQVLTLLGSMAGSAETATGAPVSGAGMPNLFMFYILKMMSGMSPPVFLVSMAGLIYGLIRRSKADIVLISFSLIMYFAVSVSADTHLYFPRYILPIMPVLAVLGGRVLADGLEKLAAGREGVVGAVLVALLCVIPAREIALANHLMVQPDTRVLAKDWMHANVPAGSKVFIEGLRVRVYPATVPLENSKENLREGIKYFLKDEPGKAKYFQMKLKVLSGITYDLVVVQTFRLEDLQSYLDKGVEYFVLRPDNYAGSRLQNDWADFVDQVESHPDVSLIQDFVPDPRSTPGSRIAIYGVGKE